MLIDAQTSALLIIDIQEKLFPVIDQADLIETHTQWLIGIAHELGVPVIATEQYPAGLGKTIASLRQLIPDQSIVEKIYFSAAAEGGLFALPGGERRQFVVCGTETHVCVLQTVIKLLSTGCDVFVVEEAVGSRKASDKALALSRMRDAGAVIVSREMVAFEWLERAGTDIFRTISQKYIR